MKLTYSLGISMNFNGLIVKQTYLTRYCKSRLGYASKNGVKIKDLVCMALEVDGMQRPMDKTSNEWIKECITHIVGKNKSEKLQSCTKQRSSEVKLLAQIKLYDKSARVKSVFPKGNVASDSFLSSYEWRKVRMVALKMYGPKCQCCGATPADGAVMNVDHIKPRKLYPSLALDVKNLQVLCHSCNHGKGNWDQTDWRT